MTKASEKQVGGSHYKDLGDFQPWDVLRHWLTPEEYRGYQKGVAIAYLARERAKGGDQDIAKAVHHLQKLVETLEEDETAHSETVPVVVPPAPEYEPTDMAFDDSDEYDKRALTTGERLSFDSNGNTGSVKCRVTFNAPFEFIKAYEEQKP